MAFAVPRHEPAALPQPLRDLGRVRPSPGNYPLCKVYAIGFRV